MKQSLVTSIKYICSNFPRDNLKRIYSWFRPWLEGAVAAGGNFSH
jgi:hypothetical protein